MANGIRNTKVEGYIFLVAIASFILSNGFVDCRKVETVTTKASVKHNKSVLKTIKGEGDDLIDCVDIYKQPALNHPLLKNHTIQLKPSGIETVNGVEDGVFQSWRQNGECPDGTIPIARTKAFEHRTSKPMPLPQYDSNKFVFVSPPNHEFAQVSLYGGQYIGAQAEFNVWNPAAYNKDNSLARVRVGRGSGKALSSVEAGWIRMNSRDNQTLLYTFWTGDGGQSGCYNLECPGFVQVSQKFTLGGPMSPVSSYNGAQYDIFLSIYKNTNSGHWWLIVGNEVIGYWPDTILPSLRGSAELVSWGGEIYDSQAEGHHTSTQMGSGHFPDEGFGKASYVRNVQYMDDSSPLIFKDPAGLLTYATKPSCYNLIVKDKTPKMGIHFYYGGPGFSAACR